MEQEKIKSAIESLLLVSGTPMKISRIAKILGISKPETENLVMLLQTEYSGRNKGMIIIRKEDELQLATTPENAQYVDQLVKSEIQEGLSRASLEVLSIIAYRGPISRIEVEAIRGVNCSFIVRSLLMRGLVDRMENPKDGRGYLYKISFEFLKRLGMEKVENLPDFENLSKDPRIKSVIA
ncbi:MAG: SMC-Scp complex subunit ScpB [Candidatus Moranbacteria bacterium CG10_big_fil_rev_8_21_14_0_10_35_21]|nr:MAG: SMC-Scp complex subunit ScpB [Candidatus Moranbacteria bacterium CG10_big_fil_rev_8_21_14_0_10_35_21]PJA88621.1 MAG: SMC-Scp complex subunit ScpB [Candidatus Moranbacteria bacterium CG_4_9_14_3_um_filter_36_9]